MRYLPMRRSKLTSSEGPGSLVINPDGETLLVGALDHWFQREDENTLPKLDEEFIVREPRLSNLLKVDELYQPPDYRQYDSRAEMLLKNVGLVIPLYRFPTWHYCSKCYTMRKFKLDETTVYTECSNNICEGKKRYFKQVPFVTICKAGHINEFPWVEWVHGSDKPQCNGTLTLKMSGGTTLDTWLIICSCGAKRSLKGITNIDGNKEATFGKQLNENSSSVYTCPGNRPWCGTFEEEEEKGDCSELPLAILRNSINVYMPKKISAIHIPKELSENEENIMKLLEEQPKFVKVLEKFIHEESMLLDMARTLLEEYLNVDVEDSEYINAIVHFLGSDGNEAQQSEQNENNIKYEEFEKLKTNELFQKRDLVVEPVWRNERTEQDHNHIYKRYLQRISKVSRLKETTVLYGFDRREPKAGIEYEPYIANLYKDKKAQQTVWLPASITYGEGIFVEFNKDVLRQWEQQEVVQAYFNRYVKRVEHVNHRDEMIIASPRNMMIHTMAHFLIEQFGEVSGYMSSSIRERLYLEEHQSGFLIYTASGDSEGTFGGLVKLANEEEFFRYFDIAMTRAQWCSSDPVCTELGKKHGQGVNTLNGAACHNCSHVPETSCEYVNRYLDRTLLIDSEIGFFNFLSPLI